MKKIITLSLMVFSMMTTFSQNKKEQIEQLTYSKDSLQYLIDKERNSSNEKIKELEEKIEGLEFEKNEKIKEIYSLESKVSSLNVEVDTLQLKVKEVVSQNKSITEYLNKNTPLCLQTNFKQFLNPSQKDIDDFLAQFEEETSFKTAKNEEHEYEYEIFSLTIYKNGISYARESFFEWVNFYLFLPLNLTDELKNGVERLCKNMGGCSSPEDVGVSYVVEKNGIKISWSGGC
jgi:TolA-binding protein